MERFTFDLLLQLKGTLKFGKSFAKRESVNFNGTDILVISFEDIIKDKEANPKPEDLMDIKHLIAKRKQN